MRASTNLAIAAAANVGERFGDARSGAASVPAECEGRCPELIRINAQSRSTSILGTLVELERAQQRLEARLGTLEREANAKIAGLEQQIAKARADAREKIKQRIAALRAGYDARSAKLKQAWRLTKEALAR